MTYRKPTTRIMEGSSRPYLRPRDGDGDRGDRGDRRDRGDRDYVDGSPLLKKYEDWAWELEFLPHGYVDDPRPMHLRDPILQVLGEHYFSILEVIIDRDQGGSFKFEPGKRDFIGKGDPNVVGHRFKRIGYNNLTINAKAELPRILELIVAADPARFLAFFNNSQSITTKMHQLELLPGIGKKTMWQVIDARKKKLFATFAEITERASIGKPEIAIVKRILKEIENPDEKHIIFVRH
jgi:putative nucleotide binding protein